MAACTAAVVGNRICVPRRSPRGTLSLVGFAPYARFGLCAALLAGGCLAAPPSGTAPGADGDGDGGGGGGNPDCTPFLEDGFEDPDLTETTFGVDQDPPDATVDIDGGFATLQARGSAVVGYASLRTLTFFDVATTSLEIDVDTVIEGDGIVILSLDTDDETSYDLRGHSDHIAISHDVLGDTAVDCDPCASFGEGSWTMRIEEDAGSLHFLAGPLGDTPSDLFPEGVPVSNVPMYAQVWLLAPEASDTALAIIDTFRWSICTE